MNKNIESEEINKAIDSLNRKTNSISSSDGLVTLVFSGTCEYKDIKINGFLEDINKEELEKAILEVLTLSKERSSEDVISLLMDLMKQPSDDKQDDCLTIDNVS